MFRLSELRGQAVAIEFIYTRCPMLCQVLGDTFATVLTSLPDGAAHLKLLSITFDPVNDRATELHAYAENHGANGARWLVARPIDISDIKRLLHVCGVAIIPDGLGGYQHNAAIHIVNPSGRLVRILDYVERARITAELKKWL